MKRFKSFINEGKYPMWLRLVVGGMVLKIRNLENRIKSEKDEKKKLDLISSQNSMLSYISGLGIGVGSSDKVLLSKLRKGMSVGGGRGK
tara:strand:+ start:89 stop:355 length:267 start_codon:yes stop_codon:yes gene_type:complete